MSIRSALAETSGKLSYRLLKFLTNGGSSFPGKLSYSLDPKILRRLAKNYRVVIITGTNGKTMTTALTVKMLEEKYDNILTNPTGSNMIQGIISAFLCHKQKGKDRIAILEVDEANVRRVAEDLQPEIILVTNIFRDQLDRYGEIYTTYRYILDGASQVPNAQLYLNGDLPLFNGRDTINSRLYYGFSNEDHSSNLLAPANSDSVICPQCEGILHYHMITYSNLGDYFCPHCGFKRPQLTYAVEEIEKLTMTSTQFKLGNHSYNLPVAGLYTIYNSLAAYSIAKTFNITDDEIDRAMQKANRLFGRQEIVSIGDKQILINLIKNPVGANQIINLLELETAKSSLFVLLNDLAADGQDISWIWDVDFEKLAELPAISEVFVGGRRKKDLSQRLIVAGFANENLHLILNFEEILYKIKNCQEKQVHILTTYTAMLALRKILANQGYVKERMQA